MDKDKLREIKSSFRRAMNADLSDSMRSHGVIYKLNFGVPAPRMKLIASQFDANAEDATYLWNEDVRESKILATYLYPASEMDLDTAVSWAKDIRYPEIADQITMNLFCKLPFAQDLLDALLKEEAVMLRYVAYRLLIRLCMQGETFSPERMHQLLSQVRVDLLSKVSYLCQSALQVFERFGDMGPEAEACIETELAGWDSESDEAKQYLWATICYWK